MKCLKSIDNLGHVLACALPDVQGCGRGYRGCESGWGWRVGPLPHAVWKPGTYVTYVVADQNDAWLLGLHNTTYIYIYTLYIIICLYDARVQTLWWSYEEDKKAVLHETRCRGNLRHLLSARSAKSPETASIESGDRNTTPEFHMSLALLLGWW